MKIGDIFGKLTVTKIFKQGKTPCHDVFELSCTCGGIVRKKRFYFNSIPQPKMCLKCSRSRSQRGYEMITDRYNRIKKMKEDKKKWYASGRYLRKPKPVFE